MLSESKINTNKHKSALNVFLHQRSIANKVINAVTVGSSDIIAIEYETYNDNKLENIEIKSEKRFDQIKLYCDHSIV